MKPSIVFLCLARDCAATIPNFLRFLEALQAEGLTVSAIVGENGSRDGTRELLARAQNQGRLRLVSTDFMVGQPDRLRRMALGREHLKAILEESGMSPRLVCVLDIDNAISKLPPVSAFMDAIKKLDRKWIFGVSATSMPHYYDLLAYQDESRSFEDLLDELAVNRRNIFSYYRVFKRRIYPNQRALTGRNEIECLSAFNGMSIYLADVYRASSYVDDGPSRCEHLIFNRRIASKMRARMLIDPQLILVTPSDHQAERFMPFVWRRVKKLLALASTRYHFHREATEPRTMPWLRSKP